MCWIVGIISDSSGQVADDLSVSLAWLKHRGPDSVWALMYYNNSLQNVVRGHKVDERLLQQIRLMGPEGDISGKTLVFWHTRYKTSGTHNPHNSQPFQVGHDDMQLELLFNGNIPHNSKIRRDHMSGYTFQTIGDTETLARFILHTIEEILKQPGQKDVRYALRETVKKVHSIFPGGYSVIGKFAWEVFAFKDPYGIRPLALGKRWNTHILSSEDHFYTDRGYEYIGELPNGSLLFPWEEPENLLAEPLMMHPDVFEFVYLAKDNSLLYGVNNSEVRFDLGYSAVQELHERHPDWVFDCVVAVPNGANTMRLWACELLGLDPSLPNGLTRKPHSERSFMASEQWDREKIVREKFLIDVQQIQWKRILLIDDSIVRWTTMKVMVDMLLEVWALSVDVVSASPIVHYWDRYGIAMSTRELIGIDQTDGRKLTCSEVEAHLFYDARTGKQKARLFYPSVQNFLWVFKKHGLPNVHAAYFDGNFIAG